MVFSGPSMCYLCKTIEENMEHLFNVFSFVEVLWSNVEDKMHITDYNQVKIPTTIANWHQRDFENTILNRIYNLLPSFLLWALWKEQIQRIF